MIGNLFCKLSGEISEINDKWLKMLGYTRQDFEENGLTWMDMTVEEWLPIDEIQIKEVIQHGQTSAYHKQFWTKGRTNKIDVEVAAAMCDKDEENPMESTVMAYCIDITDRKKAELSLIQAREEAIQAREEAIAASKTKSNFLSTMSHELRTPLASILGAQSLLKDTNLDREQADLVDISIRSGEGLLSLLGDVLDLSKIEAGKVALHLDTFDLREAVEESVMLVGELANKKGLELVTYFDDSLDEITSQVVPAPSSSSASPSAISLQDRARAPILVISDMQRLRQILINLIGNSIKFTEKGGALIRVSLLKKGERLRRPSVDGTAESVAHASSGLMESLLPDTPTESISIVSDENSDHDTDVRRLLIEVQDTGCGIPESKQKLLFKAFSQIDANPNRRFEGAGLGLSICRQLIYLMSGTIGVHSVVGSGSTFFFELPVSLPSAEYETKIAARHVGTASLVTSDLLQSKRFLILDSVNLSPSEIYLNKNHMTFDKVNSGDYASVLERISSKDFDCLIVCLHQNNDQTFQAISNIASAASSDKYLQSFPVLLLGSRETCSARRKIARIENLKISLAFKPVSEHQFLTGVHQAILATASETIPHFASSLQLRCLAATPASLDQPHLSSHNQWKLQSSLELRRLENHVVAEDSCHETEQSIEKGRPETINKAIQLNSSTQNEQALRRGLIATSPPLELPSHEVETTTSSQPSQFMQRDNSSTISDRPLRPPFVTPMLLAEDNQIMSRVAKKLIETKLDKVRLSLVENGEEAVTAATRFMMEHNVTYPIIWMDVMMPQIDGLQATKEIRIAENARGFTEPADRSYIVALTADTMSETRERCISAGMDEYISKPMNATTLKQVFERACRIREMITVTILTMATT